MTREAEMGPIETTISREFLRSGVRVGDAYLADQIVLLARLVDVELARRPTRDTTQADADDVRRRMDAAATRFVARHTPPVPD